MTVWLHNNVWVTLDVVLPWPKSFKVDHLISILAFLRSLIFFKYCLCGFCSDVFDPHFEATFRTRLSLPLENLAFLLGDKKNKILRNVLYQQRLLMTFWMWIDKWSRQMIGSISLIYPCRNLVKRNLSISNWLSKFTTQFVFSFSKHKYSESSI